MRIHNDVPGTAIAGKVIHNATERYVKVARGNFFDLQVESAILAGEENLLNGFAIRQSLICDSNRDAGVPLSHPNEVGECLDAEFGQP